MIRIIYTRRVQPELRQIAETIAHDNVSAANRFVKELEHVCSLLAITPEMGPLRPKIGRNVRSLGVGSYLIYYRWHAEQERVEILTAWHGRRRPPRLRG